jgi:hypothetical protein
MLPSGSSCGLISKPTAIGGRFAVSGAAKEGRECSPVEIAVADAAAKNVRRSMEFLSLVQLWRKSPFCVTFEI